MNHTIIQTAKFNRLRRRISAMEEILREIIKQQTPTANATVKRMVKLAEKGLQP